MLPEQQKVYTPKDAHAAGHSSGHRTTSIPPTTAPRAATNTSPPSKQSVHTHFSDDEGNSHGDVHSSVPAPLIKAPHGVGMRQISLDALERSIINRRLNPRIERPTLSPQNKTDEPGKSLEDLREENAVEIGPVVETPNPTHVNQQHVAKGDGDTVAGQNHLSKPDRCPRTRPGLDQVSEKADEWDQENDPLPSSGSPDSDSTFRSRLLLTTMCRLQLTDSMADDDACPVENDESTELGGYSHTRPFITVRYSTPPVCSDTCSDHATRHAGSNSPDASSDEEMSLQAIPALETIDPHHFSYESDGRRSSDATFPRKLSDAVHVEAAAARQARRRSDTIIWRMPTEAESAANAMTTHSTLAAQPLQLHTLAEQQDDSPDCAAPLSYGDQRDHHQPPRRCEVPNSKAEDRSYKDDDEPRSPNDKNMSIARAVEQTDPLIQTIDSKLQAWTSEHGQQDSLYSDDAATTPFTRHAKHQAGGGSRSPSSPYQVPAPPPPSHNSGRTSSKPSTCQSPAAEGDEDETDSSEATGNRSPDSEEESASSTERPSGKAISGHGGHWPPPRQSRFPWRRSSSLPSQSSAGAGLPPRSARRTDQRFQAHRNSISLAHERDDLYGEEEEEEEGERSKMNQFLFNARDSFLIARRKLAAKHNASHQTAEVEQQPPPVLQLHSLSHPAES